MKIIQKRKLEEVSAVERWQWNENDGPLLIRLVKQCQKLGSSGAHGEWKAFLKAEYPKFRSQDPALHHWKVLAAFVNSLTAEPDVKMVLRHIKWERLVRAERQALAAAAERGAAGSGNRGGSAGPSGHPQEPAGDGSPAAPHQLQAWELVERTAQHARFREAYTLPSYDKCWRRLPRREPDQDTEPVLYALDCEMCETAADARALVRVCVVDAAGDTVLDMMVKPKKRIRDYRTHVTGLTAADLQGVTARRRDAQAAVARLLGAQEGAVLVGHALHHDLAALRLDFQPVIDTSLLFSYRGLSGCVPALADLSAAVLGRQLRAECAPHNCADDARAAMRLAQHAASAPRAALVLDPPQHKVPKEQLCKLLVHSLPAGTAAADVAALVPAAAPRPVATEGDCTSGGKALLVFASPAEANQAFKLLQGSARADSLGRPQKAVALTAGANAGARVRVRKTGAHNGLMHGRDAKEDRPSWQRRRRA